MLQVREISSLRVCLVALSQFGREFFLPIQDWRLQLEGPLFVKDVLCGDNLMNLERPHSGSQ